VRVVSPASGEMASPMVSLGLPASVDNGALGEALRAKYDLIVKVLPKSRLNGIRVSTHIYNSEDDVERLRGALKKELT